MNYFNKSEITEPEMIHRDIFEEKMIFNYICSGKIDKIKKYIIEHRLRDNNVMGKLSTDPVVNLKYHMVILAGIITRACISCGMEIDKAFRISDYYIKQLDNISTEDKIESIYDEMILDFTSKMSLINHDNQLTKPINKTINYIYTHIEEKITIKQLAEYTNVSPSYLSREFHKEVGMTISDYIRVRKLELAKELLINTDKSILEIAHFLSFSSQSHFTQVFKHIAGMTPKEYRSRFI